MKTKIVTVMFIAAMALSFKMSIDKTSATVSTVDGIQVFVYSKPTAKYDVSGSVKEAFITSSDNEKRIKSLVERAKDKFPSMEGIIVTNDLKNAEVIRFKD